MGDVSQRVSELLVEAQHERPGAFDALVDALYRELRRVAARHMQQERLDHTLQPTALVHEAYLRLARDAGGGWKDHAHFVRSAARAMRQVLVDHARRRNRDKRGGNVRRVSFDSSASLLSDEQPPVLLALDDALTELDRLDPRQAAVVELLYFVGLDQQEAARSLGVSPRTVSREWRLARNWLRDRVRESVGP